MKTIQLFYTQGTSDKQYDAIMYSNPDGSFTVESVYGRRGNTKSKGKGVSNVDQAEAKAVFQNLIAEKKAKGYTTGKSGYPYGPVDIPDFS